MLSHVGDASFIGGCYCSCAYYGDGHEQLGGLESNAKSYAGSSQYGSEDVEKHYGAKQKRESMEPIEPRHYSRGVVEE
ncbi:unnamed protein product [Nippostrongylus brasiliensis]|uniref:Uncharacterized protein n=1 Tax=Nippostrongylus brasiliensis TaxID=27835 RepID=A0A0N4XNQ8_NIPBR|nr:unnamed protein product [Nippostrongylus brasiliensis]